MLVGIEEARLLRLINEVLLVMAAETGIGTVVQMGDRTGTQDGPRQSREWVAGHRLKVEEENEVQVQVAGKDMVTVIENEVIDLVALVIVLTDHHVVGVTIEARLDALTIEGVQVDALTTEVVMTVETEWP